MQSTKYLRIYSDDQGESHFDDVEVNFKPVDFTPFLPPIDFASLFPATSCSLISGPAEVDFDEFHPAPRRQLLCMVQGEGEMRTSDGSLKVIKTGNLVLVEDTTGKGHSSRFTSEGDIIVLVVVLG